VEVGSDAAVSMDRATRLGYIADTALSISDRLRDDADQEWQADVERLREDIAWLARSVGWLARLANATSAS
jgi:hypothetical protein